MDQNVIEFEIAMNDVALVDLLVISQDDLVKYCDNIVLSEFASIGFHVFSESALIAQFHHEIDVFLAVIKEVEFRNVFAFRSLHHIRFLIQLNQVLVIVLIPLDNFAGIFLLRFGIGTLINLSKLTTTQRHL